MKSRHGLYSIIQGWKKIPITIRLQMSFGLSCLWFLWYSKSAILATDGVFTTSGRGWSWWPFDWNTTTASREREVKCSDNIVLFLKAEWIGQNLQEMGILNHQPSYWLTVQHFVSSTVQATECSFCFVHPISTGYYTMNIHFFHPIISLYLPVTRQKWVTGYPFLPVQATW